MNRKLAAIMWTIVLMITFAVSVNIVTYATSILTIRNTHDNIANLREITIPHKSPHLTTAPEIKSSKKVTTTINNIIANNSEAVNTVFIYDVEDIIVEEEEYIDDIPFVTQEVFALAKLDLSSITKEDEAYVDDIPFDTRLIFDSYNSGK